MNGEIWTSRSTNPGDHQAFFKSGVLYFENMCPDYNHL